MVSLKKSDGPDFLTITPSSDPNVFTVELTSLDNHTVFDIQCIALESFVRYSELWDGDLEDEDSTEEIIDEFDRTPTNTLLFGPDDAGEIAFNPRYVVLGDIIYATVNFPNAPEWDAEDIFISRADTSVFFKELRNLLSEEK